MTHMEIFATRLQERRKALNLSQKALGDKIGVTPQTISAYEKSGSGEKGKMPTLDKAIALAEKLEVSLDYLCGIDAPKEDREMGSLRGIAECLIEIARYVRCYGGVKTRKLTEDEYLAVNCGLPDEYATETTSMAVFTMDNPALAHFFETKNKLMGLYQDGVIDESLYGEILKGQLANLAATKVTRKTPWTPDGIFIEPNP